MQPKTQRTILREERRWRKLEKGKKGIYAVTEKVGTACELPLTSCPKQLNFM